MNSVESMGCQVLYTEKPRLKIFYLYLTKKLYYIYLFCWGEVHMSHGVPVEVRGQTVEAYFFLLYVSSQWHQTQSSRLTANVLTGWATLPVSKSFTLFLVCAYVCSAGCMHTWCVGARRHESRDTLMEVKGQFVKLIVSFHIYEGSKNWNQTLRAHMASNFTCKVILLTFKFNFHFKDFVFLKIIWKKSLLLVLCELRSTANLHL